MTFIDKVRNRNDGIVLYGLIPPKKGTGKNQIREIAERQAGRLDGREIDGIVIYDIQDEASRTKKKRPFPYIETVDSLAYGRELLESVPKIIYRPVGKYDRRSISEYISDLSPDRESTVLVGSTSSSSRVTMQVTDAYRLGHEINNDVLFGGVTIPERHESKGDEHIRMFEKISKGCSFFVSQVVYDVNATKNMLSDYYYYGREKGIPLAPVIFTFSPCGSEKTLQFMEWLGISIPKWLTNDLLRSSDILQKSVDYSEQSWLELTDFAREKGIRIGCNIESVATRKEEVDASIELLDRLSGRKRKGSV